MKRSTFFLAALAPTLLWMNATLSSAPSTDLALLPRPAQLTVAAGTLAATQWQWEVVGPESFRVRTALARLARDWNLPGVPAAGGAGARLRIQYSTTGKTYPELGESEAYRLTVGADGVSLTAENDLGILRGLATLTQLGPRPGEAFALPFITIADAPRFPWRGLLVDVGRHFQPPEVMRRILDGMYLAKLNVLHLHVTEDQGFRIESLTYPELHRQGSDGLYFTQDEIRELVRYAAERGIRVVPEFDLPGHATSWLVAHPEFASLPGPYRIERRWGIFDPTLDPTQESLYPMLATVFGEMATLFPDAYFHIGGDENNGVQWSANPRIQHFIQQNNLKDNAGLQAYFNRRAAEILRANGKHMMGWDEILHPDLPRDIVIQSWRGASGLAQAARAGCAVVLSNGYYIDLSHPADVHYLNDPLPSGHGLTPEEEARVLGGEATMWAEWVNTETIEGRIWPRTAAIAERLWSPREVRDVPDLYRRLPIFADWLARGGSRHDFYFEQRSKSLITSEASSAELSAVRNLLKLLEPLREYKRGHYQPEFTQLMPLESLADYARPDGDLARQAALDLQALLFDETAWSTQRIQSLNTFWRARAAEANLILRTPAPSSRAARELHQAAIQIVSVSPVIEEALAHLEAGRPAPPGWLDRAAGLLHSFGQPGSSGTLWRFHPELRKLLAACVDPEAFRTLPPEERRRRLEALTPQATSHH